MIPASDAPGFTGGTLDRADAIRHDPAAFAAAAADRRARLLVLGPGWQPEVTGAEEGGGRLAWTGLADAPAEAELVLLGLDPAEGDRPRFAAIASAGPEMGGGASFRSPAMMAALGSLTGGDAATYAAARSVLHWHSRHRFCANCGSATTVFRAGWARRCPACAAEHFPRVDPVVIMIPEHGGRALLGRQAAWPEGRYSALAGFLEPGESVEEAVAREIAEEAGIAVTDVRYVASQPWPFPHAQLMLACVAQAADDAITLDTNELEDAIWVPRDEVRRVLAGGEGAFLPPPPYAIAHTLLARWAQG